MGMTIVEKILAAHAGRREVRPGEMLTCTVDLVMAPDDTAALSIAEFRRSGQLAVWDREKIAIVLDHFVPAKDVRAAEQSKVARDFAREQGITHFYEVGRAGIGHAFLPEAGLVVPGDLVIAGDSHAVNHGGIGAFATGMGSTDVGAIFATGQTWLRVPETLKFIYHGRPRPWVSAKDLILYTIGRIGDDGASYAAMEFTGEAITGLSVEGRFTMCNMSVEAGAKCGIVAPDAKTVAYVASRAKRPYTLYQSDPDAEYAQVYEIDAAAVDLQVAFPHLPSRTRPIGEVGEVPIDQVVIGSCTNGWLEDLRVAAAVLRGRTVHPRVRLLVIPSTQSIFRRAVAEGLIEVFLAAGAAVTTPTCGPCSGMHSGCLAAGERCLATTNRNFVGRMGHISSEVYLAGPAVAAASAVAGRIAGPAEVLA